MKNLYMKNKKKSDIHNTGELLPTQLRCHITIQERVEMYEISQVQHLLAPADG